MFVCPIVIRSARDKKPFGFKLEDNLNLIKLHLKKKRNLLFSFEIGFNEKRVVRTINNIIFVVFKEKSHLSCYEKNQLSSTACKLNLFLDFMFKYKLNELAKTSEENTQNNLIHIGL